MEACPQCGARIPPDRAWDCSPGCERALERAHPGASRLPGVVLRVVIPGPPVAKGRPRLSTRGGHARAYTPPATRAWERLAGSVARSAASAAGWSCSASTPLSVRLWALKARPKGGGFPARKRDPDTRLPRVVKPDLDNVCKAALDALEAVGVIAADQQVAHLEAWSLWCARDEDPAVVVELRSLADDSPDL